MTTLLAALAICTVVQVHDGDSLRCDGEKVRLANIDAPELRGSSRCSQNSLRRLANSQNRPWCDHDLAIRARDALRAFVLRGQVTIHREGVDRYGRTLSRVTVNNQDAGQHLISLRLARAWVR